MSELTRTDATDFLKENGYTPKEIGKEKVDLLFQCMKFKDVIDECYTTKELNKQMNKIIKKMKVIINEIEEQK